MGGNSHIVQLHNIAAHTLTINSSLLDRPEEVAQCGRVGGIGDDILQLLHCIGQAAHIYEQDCWPILSQHTTA